ncbi:MAG: chromate efflux transporter [Fulvivirga sp.]|nr:chromate efflux transporter [Fulvivirga sp.]
MMEPEPKKQVSLYYILKTFLTIGSVSFGGYSSLVSMVKVNMVDRDKTISDNIIFEGFSIASLLPGPVAVNTVAYIGYYLRGWYGAMIAFSAVIIPSFLLVVILTHLYLMYAEIPAIRNILAGVTPVILAIIFSVGVKLSRKNINSIRHIFILACGFLIHLFMSGYLVFILSLVLAAVLGLLLFRNVGQAREELTDHAQPDPQNSRNLPLLLVFCVIAASLVFILAINPSLLKIAEVFGKVSLTLFGGGYVMIPILEGLLVSKLNWLTKQEFIDAIAIGQLTPGPILISAAFVGYKLNGILGALVGTIAIFGPSAAVMVIIASKVHHLKNNKIWLRIMEGVRPMVISFIFYSIWVIFEGLSHYYFNIIIFVIGAYLMVMHKINFLYIMLGGAVLGLLFFNIAS